MKHKLLANDAGERTFILILEEDHEAFACLTAFARQERITAASVTAIGAFRSATIAFFEFETKNYKKIPVEVQTEVLSLMGDVAVDEKGEASLHLRRVGPVRWQHEGRTFPARPCAADTGGGGA
jgi:predicted DNA-binding protein with PD1-like motif